MGHWVVERIAGPLEGRTRRWVEDPAPKKPRAEVDYNSRPHTSERSTLRELSERTGRPQNQLAGILQRADVPQDGNGTFNTRDALRVEHAFSKKVGQPAKRIHDAGGTDSRHTVL